MYEKEFLIEKKRITRNPSAVNRKCRSFKKTYFCFCMQYYTEFESEMLSMRCRSIVFTKISEAIGANIKNYLRRGLNILFQSVIMCAVPAADKFSSTPISEVN